jgi:hypothetical protein
MRQTCPIGAASTLRVSPSLQSGVAPVGSEAHHNRRQRDIEDRIIAPRRSNSAHLHRPWRAIRINHLGFARFTNQTLICEPLTVCRSSGLPPGFRSGQLSLYAVRCPFHQLAACQRASPHGDHSPPDRPAALGCFWLPRSRSRAALTSTRRIGIR